MPTEQSFRSVIPIVPRSMTSLDLLSMRAITPDTMTLLCEFLRAGRLSSLQSLAVASEQGSEISCLSQVDVTTILQCLGEGACPQLQELRIACHIYMPHLPEGVDLNQVFCVEEGLVRVLELDYGQHLTTIEVTRGFRQRGVARLVVLSKMMDAPG